MTTSGGGFVGADARSAVWRWLGSICVPLRARARELFSALSSQRVVHASRSRASAHVADVAMLKLVGSARFRPLRNVWMLEELGIKYVHDPARPRSDAARAVNPFGKVPTLVDGDVDGEVVLYESAAINTYLGDKFRGSEAPGEVLVPPAGTALRGRYDQLVCMIISEVDAQGLWMHRKHASEVAQYIGELNPAATEVARRHTASTMRVVASELGDGPYLLGQKFSAADILLVHCMDWAESIGWGQWLDSDDAPMVKLREYAERCRARPAYARAKALP